MKTDNTFIAPSIISLRDGIKKLSALLEARPKIPVGASDVQVRLLERFHDFQVRMGGGLETYEMEIDKMLEEL